jgi:hypothetical protein
MEVVIVRQANLAEMAANVPPGPFVVLGYIENKGWPKEGDDIAYEGLFCGGTPRNLKKFSNRIAQFWARGSDFLQHVGPWSEAKKHGLSKHEWFCGVHEVQLFCLKWAQQIGRLVVCVPPGAPSDAKIKQAVAWLCAHELQGNCPMSKTEYGGGGFETYSIYAHERD